MWEALKLFHQQADSFFVNKCLLVEGMAAATDRSPSVGVTENCGSKKWMQTKRDKQKLKDSGSPAATTWAPTALSCY